MSSTASPATNPAVRAEPGGHERGDHRPLSRPGRGPRRARPVHGQGPVPACAAPSRSAGPAGEVEAEPGFFEARHRRPLRSGARSGEFARTAEHDPMCSRGGPSPARSATTPRSTSSRPPAPPWTRSRSPCWAWTSTTGRNSSTTAWCGGPGTWTSTPARSRPHGKNDQATIETREATTWCAATPPRYRHGRRRRASGAGPPVGAGPAPESTS